MADDINIDNDDTVNGDSININEDDEIKFYRRQWIYPEGKYDGTHYIGEIGRSYYTFASFTISDGSHSIYIDLDYGDDKEYNESMAALNTLIEGLETMKTQLATQRAVWIVSEDYKEYIKHHDG